MAKNDGGPAFPMPSGYEPRVDCYTHFNEGMSLRDWFAGQAFFCAGMILSDTKMENRDGVTITPKEVARGAYRIADAMLAERERENDGAGKAKGTNL